MAKRRKLSKCVNVRTASVPINSLLGLPKDLLQLILNCLGDGDLLALLQASKVTAQQVMQHSEGKLWLSLQVKPGRKWAATRHLLQWAPPACLKVALFLQRVALQPKSMDKQQVQLQQLGAAALEAVFGMQRQQQMPCLLHVSLQGFMLHSILPPGLAATCPNIHTLQLVHCYVLGDASQQVSTCSRNVKGGAAECHPAPGIRTLMLDDTPMPPAGFKPKKNARLTRCQQHLLDFVEHSKRSLPNVSCMHLEVRLPEFAPDKSLVLLNTLAPRLQRCGVRVRADTLSWILDDSHMEYTEQQYAAVRAAISPALGPQAEVKLCNAPVGVHVLDVLAKTHQHTLTALSLTGCSVGRDVLQHMHLAQLPSLRSVGLGDSRGASWDVCEGAITAMAQQAPGRRLAVVLSLDEDVHATTLQGELRVLTRHTRHAVAFLVHHLHAYTDGVDGLHIDITRLKSEDSAS